MPSHNPSDRCVHRDPSGRRCRLPRKPSHPDLCSFHARLHPEGTLEDPQKLLAEVLGPDPDLSTTEAINKTVTKLLALHIARRLPARHVAIAGYLCQFLIQTLPHFEREERLAIEARKNLPVRVITNIPRPKYPDTKRAESDNQPEASVAGDEAYSTYQP